MGDFDEARAKKFLRAREEKEKKEREEERQKLLQKVIAILQEEFQNTAVEVYLVGSLLRPFLFTPQSDIDIVLKNYRGDRFDLWPQLEEKMGRKVEIILYETCHFQEFIMKEGYKVC